MTRHELTDDQWALLSEFFPPRLPRRGGQWKDDRLLLNGIFWRLNTGAPWRDRPERYGPWPTVCRFAALRRSGRLDRVIEKLQLHLNEAGFIDPEQFCIDGTNVRPPGTGRRRRREKNPPPGEPADHARGRSRGGFGTKVHVVTDDNGLPWLLRSPRGRPTRGPPSRW